MAFMFAIIRFAEVDPALLRDIERVAEFWRAKEGNVLVEVLVNVDEPTLITLLSQWKSVRAYRQAFSGYDAKMLLTPVMLRAIDEPSAYLRPGEL